jgi:hypothetical protein
MRPQIGQGRETRLIVTDVLRQGYLHVATSIIVTVSFPKMFTTLTASFRRPDIHSHEVFRGMNWY